MPPPPTLFPTYLVPSLPFRRRLSSVDSTASSSSSSSSPTGYAGPGSPPQNDSYLAGHASHLRCARCLSDLALSSQIISKGFTGRHGRAYLVAASPSSISTPTDEHPPPPSSSSLSRSTTLKAKNDALPNLPNTYTHKPVPRQLVTGAHTVGDVSCAHCGSVLGWKYVAAEEDAQRYKIGKFILETKRVCRASTWDTDRQGSESHARAVDARMKRESWARRRSSSSLSTLPPPPPSEMPGAVLEDVDEVEFDSQDEDECEDLFMGVWTPQLAVKRRRAKLLGSVGQD